LSDHLPDIRLGSRVRIMQTDDMVRRGIANLRGDVISIDRDRGAVALVKVDGRKYPLAVSFAALMLEARK
jgi:hypothetical protein